MTSNTPSPIKTATDTIQINKWRFYKNRGYIVIDEVWEGFGTPTVMKSAYSLPNYYYIGSSVDAYRKWKTFGITHFEPRSENKSLNERPIFEKAKQALLEGHTFQLRKSPCCSIGFSEKDQKWYGWSHRAIYGFAPGSEVKKGDCGYVPDNNEEAITDILRFWDFDRQGNWVRPEWWGTDQEENVTKKVMNEIVLDVPDPHNEQEGLGMILDYTTHVLDDRKTLGNRSWHSYGKFGRGEWKAKTMDDAKQMARDFANGVD